MASDCAQCEGQVPCFGLQAPVGPSSQVPHDLSNPTLTTLPLLTGPSLFCKWAPTLGLPRQRATWLTHSSHTVHVLKSHLLTEADSEPSFKWQIRYSNIKTVPIHQASSPSPCFTFTWHLAYNLTICDSLSTSTCK